MAISKQPITKLIVPLAGTGTRFAPLSSVYPKEMAFLVDKPVLQYLVQEAYLSGITEIIFIINPQKNSIQDYFSTKHQRVYQQKSFPDRAKMPESLTELNVLVQKIKFRFITRDATLGDGHSILLAHRFIKPGEPFAVSMGDLLSFSDKPFLGQLKAAYARKGKPVISVQEVSLADLPDVSSKNGMIAVKRSSSKLHLIDRIVEKPGPRFAPSRLILTGKYVLEPGIFKYLKKMLREHTKGELKLADALQQYAQDNDLFALECRGKILDTGNKLDFLKASVLFGASHKEFGKPFRNFLKNGTVHP